MISKYLWSLDKVPLHVLYLEWTSLELFTWQALLSLKDLVYSSISEGFFLFLQFHAELFMNHCCALINPFLLSEPHNIYFICSHFSPSDYDILVGRDNVRFIFYCILSIKFSACYKHSDSVNTNKINECDLNTTHIKSVPF